MGVQLAVIHGSSHCYTQNLKPLPVAASAVDWNMLSFDAGRLISFRPASTRICNIQQCQRLIKLQLGYVGVGGGGESRIATFKIMEYHGIFPEYHILDTNFNTTACATHTHKKFLSVSELLHILHPCKICLELSSPILIMLCIKINTQKWTVIRH